jgi:hypothetical protein
MFNNCNDTLSGKPLAMYTSGIIDVSKKTAEIHDFVKWYICTGLKYRNVIYKK